jgi:methylenetetrahydrofolate dehydrogenase (NADP+)/methenyltetrahydrofolate cyclohydrolase
MLSNDGAEVWSFDVDGPLFFAPAPDGGAHSVHETNIDRSEALAQADIVITGVPSKEFPLIQPSEIREGAICLNFSTRRNFAENITDKASVFVPRVGPMTVTMAIRNVLRLYRDAKV